MQRFDCLEADCPLLGPHLLEASAGTGKTFSIEHIFVRLLLESMDLEQILTVTFTRAATRELKARIRANIEKALGFLRAKEAPWPYLQPHIESEEAIRILSDALGSFDRVPIFTIHGFCYRMLKEFAFEAQIGFSIPNPDEGNRVQQKLKQAASDFLQWGLRENLLCPEQLATLMKKYRSLDEIVDALLRLEKGESGPDFSALLAQCKAALQRWSGEPIELEKLKEDFQALRPSYKAVEGNLEAQVTALAHCFSDPVHIRTLLKERGTLFVFLDPSNRKVKFTPPSFLHYPGFFDWARLSLSSLVEMSAKASLQIIQEAWHPIGEKIIAQEEFFDPDEILLQMRKAVAEERFAACVRKKYAAAIIDEFQDTDELQWEIFYELFLKEPTLRAFYLVGDPKQSIYRFRKADIYTYLKARDYLGEAHLYHLDTNFRSSKSLIGALNALFEGDWLQLPKTKRALPFQPVKPGKDLPVSFSDGKGSLHFTLAEGEDLFEGVFLPHAILEIERLRSEYKDIAILIKDRHQAEKALELLTERGIPAIARSHTPIGETEVFHYLQELFQAILTPRDSNLALIVEAGPLGTLPLADLKLCLEEGGLPLFARTLFDQPGLRERMIPFYRDLLQILEMLFAWEQKEGFSFEGLQRYLQHLKTLSAEEGGRRRMEADEGAVQIMTFHISKGLEFDLVFALGLASRTPEAAQEREEMEAEKQRLLYVAFTRARKRLYAPLPLGQKEAAAGTHSPIELFCRHWEQKGPLLEQLEHLSKQESITFEHLATPFSLPPAVPTAPALPTLTFIEPANFYTPSYLLSFTSLSRSYRVHGVKEQEAKMAISSDLFTLQTMPRGAETGVAIHQIFERLFSSKEPLWRFPREIDALVSEELRFSPLLRWKEAIQQMVQQTLLLPLQGDGEFFTLSELEPQAVQSEIEFAFSHGDHFVKGVIDLVFWHRGKVYFIDWKTNWLEAYEEESIQKEMADHDYWLQAALYAEALQRQDLELGGAFYLFLRGNRPLSFLPDRSLLEKWYE